jgi:hypothetical protein
MVMRQAFTLVIAGMALGLPEAIATSHPMVALRQE